METLEATKRENSTKWVLWLAFHYTPPKLDNDLYLLRNTVPHSWVYKPCA